MTMAMMRTFGFDDLELGQCASLMRTVMESDVVGFAQVSGDHNPIHLSDDYAASTKFGQRIAHGMLTASLISAVIGTQMPGPGAVYLSQTLRFLGPVKIGDVVTAMVEVAEKIEKGRRVRQYLQTSPLPDHAHLRGSAVCGTQRHIPSEQYG